VNVSSTQSNPSSTLPEGPSQELGRHEFLNLLVAQLTHQDPLSPMEGTEFVTQLAQFSSVEQLMSIDKRLGLIEVGQASAMNTQAAGFIGRTVTAHGDGLGVVEGQTPRVTFDLDGFATSATITLTDEQGRSVSMEHEGALAAGSRSVQWDQDIELEPGRYRVSVEAKNAAGETVGAHPFVRGTVSEVSFEAGVPELVIDGVHIRLGDVISIATGAGQ
jgi:flagellar basal-body rod modification protein FlgD